MKRPCPICGIRPVVYKGADHCSYDCWSQSIDLRNRALGIEPEREPEELLIDRVTVEQAPNSLCSESDKKSYPYQLVLY